MKTMRLSLRMKNSCRAAAATARVLALHSKRLGERRFFIPLGECLRFFLIVWGLFRNAHSFLYGFMDFKHYDHYQIKATITYVPMWFIQF
jgi:hypothetical protein